MKTLQNHKTYATITYYGVPECIEISQNRLKTRIFRAFAPWTPTGVLSLAGGAQKRSVSHPGVTIWWPIYISRGFSARPLNVK